jgi:hypothetical protein
VFANNAVDALCNAEAVNFHDQWQLSMLELIIQRPLLDMFAEGQGLQHTSTQKSRRCCRSVGPSGLYRQSVGSSRIQEAASLMRHAQPWGVPTVDLASKSSLYSRALASRSGLLDSSSAYWRQGLSACRPLAGSYRTMRDDSTTVVRCIARHRDIRSLFQSAF